MLAFALGMFSLAASDKAANIVMILVDDQDIVLGGLTPVPNIKKLLKEEGAFFSNHFVTSTMCVPTRTTILSGRYPHNFGDPQTKLDPTGLVDGVNTKNQNQTVGQWVRMAGRHKTLYIGKWHNDCCKDWCSEESPNCTMPMEDGAPTWGVGFDRWMPMPQMNYAAPGFNNISWQAAQPP
jgi:N-acetylglucosamine-6-sulfatase